MGSTLFWIIMAAIGIKVMLILAEKKAKEYQKDRLLSATGMTTEKAKKIFNNQTRQNSKPKEYFKNVEITKSPKEKGDDFERHVSEYFRKQGYLVSEHGLDNGKKDHGIDVIAKREKEIIFIQCKNWRIDHSHKIKDSHIKEFIGNCTTYLEKNQTYGMYTIKRYYAVSEECMEYSAERFISENPQSIQKLLLPMPTI